MKKYKILCDADDTIENLTEYWLEEINKRYNKCVKKQNITDWDLTKAYPDLRPEDVLAPLYMEGFWERITPVRDSGYYLKRLMDDGHELYIVTASNRETKEAKTKKLLEMFPFLNVDRIIFTQNKQAVDGDILIDDGVHNLIGGKYHKFLFNQPNNQCVRESDYGITRVYSWKEIYERIQNIE